MQRKGNYISLTGICEREYEQCHSVKLWPASVMMFNRMALRVCEGVLNASMLKLIGTKAVPGMYMPGILSV